MMLPAHIARIDIGEGAAEDVARHYDSYLAVSMDLPWALARERLGKPVRQVHLVLFQLNGANRADTV